MKYFIRDFTKRDTNQVIKIYQNEFARQPWNEKWTYEAVKEDIEFCKNQKYPKILVAEKNYEIVGFCWGYQLPMDKFQFLKGKIKEPAGYGDELAVKDEYKRNYVGETLTLDLINFFRGNEMRQFILRTLTTTNAYPLCKKLGFKDIGRLDPNDTYENRVYLTKDL